MAGVLGVPAAIIEKPPSAGLWPGQTDEDEIGLTYDELDAALSAIERGAADQVPAATRDRVLGLMNASNHKRSAVPAYRRTEREVAATP